jgi:SlyX protein
MHDTPPVPTPDLTETSETALRLEALEIKSSYTDDTLDQLSAQLYRQQSQIERLLREVLDLRGQLDAARASGEPLTLRDELPPHY